MGKLVEVAEPEQRWRSGAISHSPAGTDVVVAEH